MKLTSLLEGGADFLLESPQHPESLRAVNPADKRGIRGRIINCIERAQCNQALFDVLDVGTNTSTK